MNALQRTAGEAPTSKSTPANALHATAGMVGALHAPLHNKTNRRNDRVKCTHMHPLTEWRNKVQCSTTAKPALLVMQSISNSNKPRGQEKRTKYTERNTLEMVVLPAITTTAHLQLIKR